MRGKGGRQQSSGGDRWWGIQREGGSGEKNPKGEKTKADKEIGIRGRGERRGGIGSDKGNRVKMSKQRRHKEKGWG